MALGGVPFYLNLIDQQLSATQNINNLFFGINAPLKGEYYILFASLFKNHNRHITIIDALTSKKKGLFKSEILKLTKFSDGGSFTKLLNELEASDFIRKYRMPERKSRNLIYQLTDNFSLFYTNFIKNGDGDESDEWLKLVNTPAYNAWAGNAFEILCLQHVDCIKKALGISGIHTSTYTWSNKKSQIDLIIDRKDKVVNLIEIKYSDKPYTITQEYTQKLMTKVTEFNLEKPTRKAIWLVLLPTYGLTSNANRGQIQNVLDMNIFFE